MRTARAIALLWIVVIGVLLLVELAEITDLFTLPVQSALGNVLGFIFALVFTTILALIGAIFIGIYISQRLSTSVGFSPFEEEMLRMRSDVQRIRADVEALKASSAVPPAAGADPKERE